MCSKLIDCAECGAQGDQSDVSSASWQLLLSLYSVFIDVLDSGSSFLPLLKLTLKTHKFSHERTHTQVGRYLGQESDNNLRVIENIHSSSNVLQQYLSTHVLRNCSVVNEEGEAFLHLLLSCRFYNCCSPVPLTRSCMAFS